MMETNYFMTMYAVFALSQLSAMQEQAKSLKDVDANCIATIAHYLSRHDCAQVRKTCTQLNITWWNYSSDPICIRPPETMRNVPEVLFWRELIATIVCLERVIESAHPNLDTNHGDIPNALILKLGWFRKLSHLPKKLTQTSCVRSLDLSGCHIPGFEIAKLPRLLPLLYALNLTANQLTYFPQEFFGWTSLQSVWLGDNRNATYTFNSCLPRSITYLDLSFCGYTKIPFFLEQMKQLKGLNLAHNAIECPQLADLPCRAPQLEELDVSFNGLADLPCHAFCYFSALRRLNLSGNSLHISYGLKMIATILPHLVELDLGQNSLTMIDLLNLTSCNNGIKILHLEGAPGCNGYEKWKENVFSSEDQVMIKEMLPRTKIIFPDR